MPGTVASNLPPRPGDAPWDLDREPLKARSHARGIEALPSVVDGPGGPATGRCTVRERRRPRSDAPSAAPGATVSPERSRGRAGLDRRDPVS